MEYTTIKIPKATYESAKRLQAEIARNGTNNISNQIKEIAQSTTCPLCKTKMNSVQAGYGMHSCPNCGFNKQTFDLSSTSMSSDDAVRALAVTGLVLLGIAVLAALLKK